MGRKINTDNAAVLEEIFDSCAVGIARIENQILTRVNAQLLKIFGYHARTDMENKPFEIFFQTSQDFQFSWQIMARDLAEDGKVDYEVDMMKGDGTCFPAHICLQPADPEAPMACITATVIDISQRRSAEKKTMEKERLQGVLEMAGAICHEINQPLQAIIGYTELLVMDSESTASASCLENIKSQIARLGKITAKLANINWYKTIDYPGNQKIVDIWQSEETDLEKRECRTDFKH